MNVKDQSDETLVSLTLLGNEYAFEELVKRHQKAAMSVAMGVTKNKYTAEDAVQDAFVSAWEKLDTLRDPSRFGAWVCRIAKYRAINLAVRYRDYISFDIVENFEAERDEDICGYYNDEREKEKLRECVEGLSEKIRTVIRLYYFECLSVAEIAQRMSLSSGTVKSRLYEGRQQLRKDFGYMDKDNKNETLVEAVMRRVEELKRWRLRENKSGFEKEYREVLESVESLPESEKKYHALSDVLNLGYWWVDGEKNDELSARIKEAAIKGNNREVLGECIHRDANKLSGKEKIEYINTVAIPELEGYGLGSQIAYEHYWLGLEYYRLQDYKNSRHEVEIALSNPEISELYRALSRATLEMYDLLGDRLCDRNKYVIHCTAERYLVEGSRLIFWEQPGFTRGGMQSAWKYSALASILYYASRCDGLLCDESMRVGDKALSEDGSSEIVRFSDSEAIETPCGKFYDCAVFRTSSRRGTATVYYKRNIGIVALKFNRTDENEETALLKSYNICGGTGLIPLAVGNTWEYTMPSLEGKIQAFIKYEITHFDGKSVVFSHPSCFVRDRVDESSWSGVMAYIRDSYVKNNPDGHGALCDVRAELALAEELASTPWQRLHTRVANSVMRRILDTDVDFNPEYTEKGYWNFFNHNNLIFNSGKQIIRDDREYSFEWKEKQTERSHLLLYNDI